MRTIGQIISGLLLAPIFFLFSYACFEYWLPTRNGALIASICAAILLLLLYYTASLYVRQHREEKVEKATNEAGVRASLTFLTPEEFSRILASTPYDLADNSPRGLPEEMLLDYLRKHPQSALLNILTINGITPEASLLAQKAGISLHLLPLPEAIFETVPPRKVFVQKRHRFQPSGKGFIKSGIMILLLGLLSPYRLYYFICGLLLVLSGVGIVLYRKFMAAPNKRRA